MPRNNLTTSNTLHSNYTNSTATYSTSYVVSSTGGNNGSYYAYNNDNAFNAQSWSIPVTIPTPVDYYNPYRQYAGEVSFQLQEYVLKNKKKFSEKFIEEEMEL